MIFYGLIFLFQKNRVNFARQHFKTLRNMVSKNETTNSEKKAIIDNDEALRLIDLIHQGDSNAENELA